MATHRKRRVSSAHAIALLALFVALGGTSYAVSKLPKNSVGTEQVKDGTLQSADLALGVLQSGPRGPRGAQGPAGSKGDTGPQGPSGSASNQAWQPLPFASGWTQHPPGWASASFRKEASGVVRLRGLVTKPSAAPVRPDTIGTLPEGYRPTDSEIFLTSGGQPDGPTTIAVFQNGTVVWLAGPASTSNYISLSGITFGTN